MSQGHIAVVLNATSGHGSPPKVAERLKTTVDDGDIVTSESTLRFRSREEITTALVVSGFRVEGVRDAPDRPGREMVFIACATTS